MKLFRVTKQTQPRDPNWLSILRIGVAVIVVAKIIAEFKYAYLIYGTQGIVQGVINERIFTPFTPTLHHLVQMTSGVIEENLFISGFLILNLLLAILLFIGWQTRLMAIGCWLFHVLLFNNSPLVSYGVDSFLMSLLFYCCIFPIHLTWSVDCLRKKCSFDPKNLPQYQLFLQIHLCIVYVVAGAAKLQGVTWLNGEAVWYAINQPQFYSFFTMPLIDLATAFPAIIYALTWGTLIAEIGYGIFIWIKRIRVFFFLAILLMHLFIGAVMHLQLFALTMIFFNLAAFGNIMYQDAREMLQYYRRPKEKKVAAVVG